MPSPSDIREARKPRLLVACEESGTVREAFRRRGWDAWSCDILPTRIPGQHYQCDVREVLENGWDLMIAHPPCTYLSYVGMRHWNKPGRAALREDALAFFMDCVNAPIEHICVENPLGYPSKVYRKPDQTIHPYYFGDPFQKRICLWLKELPLLTMNKDERQRRRSKTFDGIAAAMADQWGAYVENKLNVTV